MSIGPLQRMAMRKRLLEQKQGNPKKIRQREKRVVEGGKGAYTTGPADIDKDQQVVNGRINNDAIHAKHVIRHDNAMWTAENSFDDEGRERLIKNGERLLERTKKQREKNEQAAEKERRREWWADIQERAAELKEKKARKGK